MPERDGPLLVLSLRLRSLGPPSLTALIARLEAAQDYEAFVALVREYLAERETEVLGQPSPGAQIAAFADHFEDRYFPLHPHLKFGDMEYGDLLRGIPIIPWGVSYDEYHDMPSWESPGLRLMTYLLEAPDWADDGARVPIGESCAEDIPTELLQRVPQGGLPRQEAHRLLDGTPYEALALWADMLDRDTGNFFLDIDEEYPYYEGLPDWDKGAVAELTREWQQAELILDKVVALRDRLAEGPAARFGELLDFIEQRRREMDGDAQG